MPSSDAPDPATDAVTGGPSALSMLLTAASGSRAVNVPATLNDAAADSVLGRLHGLIERSAEPIAILIAGKSGDFSGALRLFDLLRLQPVPTVGLVTGAIGPLQLAVLQACTHRLSRREAGFELVTSGSEQPRASVKMVASKTLEAVQREFTQDVEHKLEVLRCLASMIGERSLRSVDAWVRHLQSDVAMFHAATALELGLIDGLVE